MSDLSILVFIPGKPSQYLDLESKSTMRESKQLVEMNFDKLKFNYTLGFTLPVNEHNEKILRNFSNPNILDNDYLYLDVRVTTGSKVWDDVSLNITKKGKSYEAELRLKKDHWARLAKDLKLKSLPFDTIPLTCDFIESINSEQYPYSENYLGIWYPYCDYGRLVSEIPNRRANNRWVGPIELFRPWFYITGLLKKGFCAVGYGFKSPLFESELGRRLITYIADQDFGIEDTVNRLDVKAEIDPSSVGQFYKEGQFILITKLNVLNDPEGSITNGLYSNSGEVDIKGSLTVRNLSGKEANIKAYLGKVYDRDATQFNHSVYVSQEFDNVEGGDEVVFEFDFKGASITTIENIGLYIYREHVQFTPNLKPGIHFVGGEIEFKGIRNYSIPGLNESINRWIDPEITFMDLLKGLSEMFELKFKTNPVTRQVEIYQPYTASFWGETIEGFFIEQTIEDITDLLNEGSNESLTPNSSNPRYVKMEFKDGSDVYFDGLLKDRKVWSGKEKLWSGIIDLGEKYTVNETTTKTNSLFEPTLNTIPDGRLIDLSIPVLTGDEKETSFKIGPRIAIAAGLVTQSKVSLRICSYQRPRTLLIPTAYQFINSPIGNQHNNELATKEIPESNLVFGVNKQLGQSNKTLIDIIHRRYLLEQLNNLKINALVYLSLKHYEEIDFRSLYKFNHEGRTINARMQAVNDYHYLKELLTPVEFIPIRQVSDLCDLLPDIPSPDPTVCRNNPTVSTVKVGNCYHLTISGINNSPIIEGLFQYRLASGGPWIDLLNTTPISAIVCDIYEPFYIRIIVEYDLLLGLGCPNSTTPERLIVPCSEMILTPECLFVNQINGDTSIPGLKFRVGLPPQEDLTFIATVSLNGAPPINYPMEVSGDYIVGGLLTTSETFLFNFVIQSGNCPPITITKECTLPFGGSKLCEEITLNLICVSSEGCYTFIRDGLIPFDYDDYIKYRTSVDGVTWSVWKIWNEETSICSNYVQARWFVHFCDGVCPMKCSNIVSCNDGSLAITVQCQECTATVYSDSDLSSCTFNWTGPNSFSGTGISIELPLVSGNYQVTAICGSQTSSFIYYHHAPFAGNEPDGDINWND